MKNTKKPAANKTVAKTSTKKTPVVLGERVKFPAGNQYGGFPALTYRDSDISVVGIGKADSETQSDWERLTKHRLGKRVVNGALLIDAANITIAEALKSVGLYGKRSTLRELQKSKAFAELKPGQSRWATAEETAAYITAETNLRKRFFLKAIERKRRAIATANRSIAVYENRIAVERRSVTEAGTLLLRFGKLIDSAKA